MLRPTRTLYHQPRPVLDNIAVWGVVYFAPSGGSGMDGPYVRVLRHLVLSAKPGPIEVATLLPKGDGGR